MSYKNTFKSLTPSVGSCNATQSVGRQRKVLSKKNKLPKRSSSKVSKHDYESVTPDSRQKSSEIDTVFDTVATPRSDRHPTYSLSSALTDRSHAKATKTWKAKISQNTKASRNTLHCTPPHNISEATATPSSAAGREPRKKKVWLWAGLTLCVLAVLMAVATGLIVVFANKSDSDSMNAAKKENDAAMEQGSTMENPGSRPPIPAAKPSTSGSEPPNPAPTRPSPAAQPSTSASATAAPPPPSPCTEQDICCKWTSCEKTDYSQWSKRSDGCDKNRICGKDSNCLIWTVTQVFGNGPGIQRIQWSDLNCKRCTQPDKCCSAWGDVMMARNLRKSTFSMESTAPDELTCNHIALKPCTSDDRKPCVKYQFGLTVGMKCKIQCT